MNKDWLIKHYTKLLGGDIKIIRHDEGSTWNDGGSWYSTLLYHNGVMIQVDTPSNYNTDNYTITKFKPVMKECYEPVK